MLRTRTRRGRGRGRGRSKKSKEEKTQVPSLVPDLRWQWMSPLQQEALVQCAERLAKANPAELLRKAIHDLPVLAATLTAHEDCQFQHPKSYTALFPFSSKQVTPPVCKFCPPRYLRLHKTSECRNLARTECTFCGEFGHRSSFCVKDGAWPAIRDCCRAVCQHFPGFVWDLAFHRAISVYDLDLVRLLVEASWFAFNHRRLHQLTTIRNWEFRDMCFQIVLPDVQVMFRQTFVNELVQTFAKRGNVNPKRRKDLFYILHDCLAAGSKVAPDFKLSEKALTKILLRKLSSLPYEWVLPALWPLVAMLAIHRDDFTGVSITAW